MTDELVERVARAIFEAWKVDLEPADRFEDHAPYFVDKARAALAAIPLPEWRGLRLWGWFETAGDTEPVYDPPHDAPCPYCFAPITADDVRTINIMVAEGDYAKRSYFFRAHRTCSSDNPHDMDGRIFDAIAKAGD